MARMIRRTYPQPDSPMAHLKGRERAFAALKYVSGVEPEAVFDPRTRKLSPEWGARYGRLVSLYDGELPAEDSARDSLARKIVDLCVRDGGGRAPEAHPMYPVIRHSLEQVARIRAGQGCPDSLVPILSS